MWLLYFSLVILILLSLRYKSSKIIKILFVIFMGLMFTFVYDNADTELYRSQYYASKFFDWTDTEPLWMILQVFGMKLKLSFEMFRCIVFLTAISLVFSRIEKFVVEKNIILIIYCIYPFLIDMAQMRNFLAMSILVVAIPYLSDRSVKSLIKFIALIIVATLIHNVFIFYIVLSFLWLIDINLKYFAYIELIAGGVILLFKNKIPQLVLYFFKNYHNGAFALKYIHTSGVSFTMGIFLAFYYAMLFIGALYVDYMLKSVRDNKSSVYDKKTLAIMNTYNKSIAILTLTFILTLFSTDFLRISRNLIFVEYGLMLEMSRHSSSLITRTLIRFLLLLAAIMACSVFIYYSYADTVFYPAFTNNHFFEWFNFY